MTTTTAEYWSVIPLDGVEYPLSTFAKNIETWGDDRQAPVPMRGSDTRVPWIPGEQETERVADARTMALGMWVRGCDDDGGIPIDSSGREEFEYNWNIIKRILHNQGRIFTLRKRFYDESRTMRSADARARFVDGMTPSMIGQTGARFTVDLRLANPYFLGDAQTVDLDTDTGVVTATIIGDADCRKMSLDGTTGDDGASDITLDSVESSHTFNLSKATTEALSISVDFAGQVARIDDVNYSGLVGHSGSNDWFRLAVGDNTLTPSADTGAWSGTLTYYPTWN